MPNRPTFNKKITEQVFEKKADDLKNGKSKKMGKCWHCNKRIYFNNRKHGLKGAWHIDHYPVVYRDIKNQCCIGITDPLLVSNLVPACAECNISHKYEKSYKIFCNRSQCLCEKKCTLLVLVFIFINILFFIFGILFSIKYL